MKLGGEIKNFFLKVKKNRKQVWRRGRDYEQDFLLYFPASRKQKEKH